MWRHGRAFCLVAARRRAEKAARERLAIAILSRLERREVVWTILGGGDGKSELFADSARRELVRALLQFTAFAKRHGTDRSV